MMCVKVCPVAMVQKHLPLKIRGDVNGQVNCLVLCNVPTSSLLRQHLRDRVKRWC